MRKIEGPQVMAAIISIAVIALAVVFIAPDQIDKIVSAAITGIGMLGMKLLEKDNGSDKSAK